MKRNRFFGAMFRLLIGAILGASLLPMTAAAYAQIDTHSDTSLTIQYPCPNADFQLYRVAEVSAHVRFTPTADFSGYRVSLEPEDQKGWRALAHTLRGYIDRDGIKPLRCGTTDANGRLRFENLAPGLYLLVGGDGKAGEAQYTAAPSLLTLPAWDASGKWNADVVATPKYTRKTIPEPGDDPQDGNTKLRVIKIWKDDGNAAHPAIEAQLLRDGKIWDTVTLDEGNSWRHQWTGLDAKYSWQVVERDVPEGYTVTTQPDGNAFIITNTMQETPPEQEIPPTTQPPDPTEPPILNPPDPREPRLPQTGVLWWPVGILAFCGTTLLLLGLLMRRK